MFGALHTTSYVLACRALIAALCFSFPIFAPAQSLCVDSAPVGDGWGWDGMESCKIEADTNTDSTIVSSDTNACEDSDGDGWGWNGIESCRVEADTDSPIISSDTRTCEDNDGDGWGWNGMESCQVEADIDTDSRIVSSGTRTCEDNDGDGWGWNGVESCNTFSDTADTNPPTENSAEPTTDSVNIASLDELQITWGSYPLIADHSGRRLFLSVPQDYAQPRLYSAPLTYRHSESGYAFQLEGLTISAGGTLARTIAHRDVISVAVIHNGNSVYQYQLIVTGLPILDINATSIIDEPKLPGNFRWIDGERDINSGVQNLGIEIRGATSQMFDKKSFSFEVRKNDDPEKSTNFRFFDARNDDDWIADAAYRDQTFVRNLVSHDIYNAMRPFAFINEDNEPTGQATISGDIVEVILNGVYHGIYVVEERVDRKLLGLSKIDVPEGEAGERWDLVDFSDPKNGSAMYKAVTLDADLRHPQNVATDFEQSYPNSDDITYFEPLLDLMNFLIDSDDDTFVADIANRVDLASVADFWVLRLVTASIDTFNKNYYIAKSGNGKWFYVPWDFDATFAMNWHGGDLYGTVKFFKPSESLLVQRLYENPATGFNAIVQTRWNALRQTLLTTDALTARFDHYLSRMGHEVDGVQQNARNRNNARWPNSGYFGAGEPQLGQSAYLRSWIAERLAFVDGKMNGLEVR